jgi:hydrogenase maturation protease
VTHSVRVLGLGNVLMGDDALGPWVIHALEATYVFPQGVELVEIGTPGLDLVPYVAGPGGVLLVDTVKSAGVPGELRFYDQQQLLKLPPRPRLSPHDPGLTEALLAVTLAGTPPSFVKLVGVIPDKVAMGVALSAAARAALPRLVRAVVDELARLGFVGVPRNRPDVSLPWWERGAPVLEPAGVPAMEQQAG